MWTTEKRKIKDLIFYEHNPREISKEQMSHLKKSLQEFDYVELVACQPDGSIIAGHMRVKAMLQLGWKNKEIEVRVPSRHLELREFKEYLIRSNRNTGNWDYDVLANSFDPLDLHLWGFDMEELVDGVKGMEEEVNSMGEDERCGECGQKLKKKGKKNG